ncbi:hypothetical protein PYCC9005_005452 [Savitreella phatthalungensis]
MRVANVATAWLCLVVGCSAAAIPNYRVKAMEKKKADALSGAGDPFAAKPLTAGELDKMMGAHADKYWQKDHNWKVPPPEKNGDALDLPPAMPALPLDPFPRPNQMPLLPAAGLDLPPPGLFPPAPAPELDMLPPPPAPLPPAPAAIPGPLPPAQPILGDLMMEKAEHVQGAARRRFAKQHAADELKLHPFGVDGNNNGGFDDVEVKNWLKQ